MQMNNKSLIDSALASDLPYKKIRELGSGSFGLIYLVEHVHEKSTWVAKEIPLQKIEVLFMRNRSRSSFSKKPSCSRP